MIVIDGSALFAVLLGEPAGIACNRAIASANRALMSAGSLTEMLIVASRKGVIDDVQSFADALQLEVIPLTEARARSAAAGYRRYGKGFHPAALNFGDSFAYALAKEFDCPLLFVGDDFAQTDVLRALG